MSAASMLDFFFVSFGIMFLLLLLSLALQVFLANGPKDVGSDFISRDYQWNIFFFLALLVFIAAFPRLVSV